MSFIATRGYGPGATIAAVVFRAYNSAATPANVFQPTSDDSVGGWTPVGAASLSAAINEATPNDANYAQSSSGPSFDACQVKLATPSPVPSGRDRIIINYRAAQDNITQDLVLTTTLKQGTRAIATWSNELNTTTFTTFSNTLLPQQAESITDWTDLHLNFDANAANHDTLALLLTSQLGPTADGSHTVFNQPWYRVTFGSGQIAGDTQLLIVSGADNGSVVLSSTDITRGYVDIQFLATSAGTYSVQTCVVRSSVKSAPSTPLQLTIYPYSYDRVAAPYALYGVRRLLTSYTGPLIQIHRSDLNQNIDMFALPDGYIDASLINMYTRGNSGGTFLDRQTVVKVYDQTGNGRDAVPVSNSHPPYINMTAESGHGVQPDWGWRGQLYIQETVGGPSPPAQSETLSLTNMGGVAQNVSGLTVMGQFGWELMGQNSNGFDRAPVSVSVNGGTGRRAFISTSGFISFDTHGIAGGRRRDSDIDADTTAINFSFSQWSPMIATYDFANAVLNFSAFGQSTTLNPFETPGNTDNTTSDSVTIGGSSRGDTWGGAFMDVAWFQRALSNAEISSATSPQFLYENIPHRPYFNAGAKIGIEPLRTALINKLWVGTSGFPGGGFDTNNINVTDPLASVGFSPSNLLQFDHHTIITKDQNNNTVSSMDVGVWFPTALTSNHKLVLEGPGIYNYPPSTAAAMSFNEHLVIKGLVEAGYTVAQVGYPPNPASLLNTEPTALLTPYRYFVEGWIKTLNALIGGFAAGKIMSYGFSFSSGPVLVAAAVDPRISAAISHDLSMPIFAMGGSVDFLVGVIDLNTQTSCDAQDLWLLGMTGSTVKRSVILSFSNTQAVNQGQMCDWFTGTLQVGQLYQDRGTLGTFFDAAFPAHGQGPAAIANIIRVFGRY